MRHARTAAAGFALALLAACATAHGVGILVSTTPPGAACTLTRLGKSIATTAPTPAIAWVEPSGSPIAVLCRRPGFAEAAATLAAEQSWPGFDFFAHGTPPYDYPHRVDIALSPQP